MSMVNRLDNTHIQLVRDSFVLIQGMESDDLASQFYVYLFEHFPEFKPLFEGINMRRQYQMFVATLASVVDGIDRPDEVGQSLRHLGRRHEGYRVSPEYYGRFGRALVDTIGIALGSGWSVELEEAWSLMYAEMIGYMIESGAFDSI